MGIQKIRTSAYHAQTIGQVEWAHQTLMHMMGKLSKDQKVDWPCLQLYKVRHHWIQPTLFDVWAPTVLSHWLLFPQDKEHEENTSMLTTMLLIYVNSCEKPLEMLKCSPHQRQKDRSGTVIGKLTLFHWNQVTWSWLKPMPAGGGGE